MLDKNTDGNAQYRTPGQTVAQWHNGGVLVGGKSRGSRTFVQIEDGGFYPRFYGKLQFLVLICK